jgi:hypothetical protein
MIRHLTDTARLLSTEWTQTDTDARELLGTISVTFDLCDYLESLFSEQQEGGAS